MCYKILPSCWKKYKDKLYLKLLYGILLMKEYQFCAAKMVFEEILQSTNNEKIKRYTNTVSEYRYSYIK